MSTAPLHGATRLGHQFIITPYESLFLDADPRPGCAPQHRLLHQPPKKRRERHCENAKRF
jgi:hypothetical protein